MFINQLRIAFRALRRDRFYAGLNLFGLAIGLGAAMLLLLWVQDELTFDRSHRQGDHIVRVLTNWDFGGNRQWTTTTPAGLAPEAKAQLPEIQEVARVWRLSERTFQVGAAKFGVDQTLIVDRTFLDLFDFPLVKTDGSVPFSTPNGILITEELARTLFADADPLGKTLRFDNKLDLTVTGVLKNPPSNSSIQFSALLPWEPVANQMVRDPKNAFHWGQMNYTTWALVRPDADREAVAHKLAAIAAVHRKEFAPFYYALQPLHQVYLDSGFLGEWSGTGGNRQTILIFGIIGLLILAIACINYVNLATARAASRAREVGVRKCIGAGQGQLFGQLLTESALMVLAATALGATAAMLALPVFNDLSGKDLLPAHFLQPVVLRVVAGVAVLALLMAGIYPAVLLTRFNPVRTLKGLTALSGGNALLRKSLVTAQFVFSIGLIITALVMSQQMKFFREAKLGFEKEHIFSFNTWGSKTPAHITKNELPGKPGVLEVCLSDNSFIDIGSQNGDIVWEGKPPGTEFPIWQLGASNELPAFFGLELAEGRWFRPEMNGNDTTSFVINETAARKMGLLPGQTAGKICEFNGSKGYISGVVRDFHFKSLHEPIEPLVIYQNAEWQDFFYVKAVPGKYAEALAAAQAAYEKACPGKVFKYKFADDEYDALYKNESRAGRLFNFFAGLAVLISCLGLFGLAAFAAVQRTKEIGIRKVLGATVAGITGLLATDFLKLVLVAIAIASPIAWYFMQRWLSDFAYRINLHWWMFAAAGAAALLIAFLTVGFQSVRAALANPVKSLKSE
jgi:putative ABC transport system permease protein